MCHLFEDFSLDFKTYNMSLFFLKVMVVILPSNACCTEGNASEIDSDRKEIEKNKKLYSFLHTSSCSLNLSSIKLFQVSLKNDSSDNKFKLGNSFDKLVINIIVESLDYIVFVIVVESFLQSRVIFAIASYKACILPKNRQLSSSFVAIVCIPRF